MKHFTSRKQDYVLEDGYIKAACGFPVREEDCTCGVAKVTCIACIKEARPYEPIFQNNTSEELRCIPVSRLEWDSQRMTVLCEFVIQELKDGAKIPDAIREELNDLLYLYVEPKQEA